MNVINTILALVFIETFFCVGIYMLKGKGDVFYFLEIIAKNWPAPLRKPFVDCINCFASVWGTLAQVGYYYLTGFPPVKYFIVIWIIVTVIVAAMNGIVWVIYKYFENILFYYNER